MRSPACTDPNRSILRGPTSRRNYAGGEVDRPPPADFPPDLLITMVKETVILYKKVLKMKKSEICSFLSLI